MQSPSSVLSARMTRALSLIGAHAVRVADEDRQMYFVRSTPQHDEVVHLHAPSRCTCSWHRSTGRVCSHISAAYWFHQMTLAAGAGQIAIVTEVAA